MEPLQITPELLKEIRRKLGITQVEAARRCRVITRTWAAWEYGERPVTGPARIAIELLYAEANSKAATS